MKACWTNYFEWLYRADLPAVELDLRGVTIPLVDPPINCEPPSFLETQAAENHLKGGKASGIYGIHADLLKSHRNAALVSMHAVLCSVWNWTDSHLTGLHHPT